MLKKDSFAFILLISGLIAMPPLSTDFALPAYGATAAALGTETPKIALTLSFFMLGFAVGPLFYGPASERFGRRPVLLAGLGLYTATAALCTLTPNLWLLLAGRLFQGFAAAAGTVIAVACIRDSFDGPEGRRMMSYAMIINGIMPLTAPSIGVAVLGLAGWRAIYGLMTAGGLILFFGVLAGLGETIRRRNPDALSPHGLFGGYRSVLIHPVSARASLVNAFGFGTMFAFISGSPIFLIDAMHLPGRVFGLIFACAITGSILGTFASTVLIRRKRPANNVMAAGLILMLAATGTLLALSLAGSYVLLPMVGLFFLSNFGMGMVGPNASYAAVQYLPELAGPASAVLASTQMVIGAISSSLMAGLFAVVGPAAMPAAMAGFAVLAAAVYFTRPQVRPQ